MITPHAFEKLKEVALPLEQVVLMGPTVQGVTVDFYCQRDDAPDDWWRKRLAYIPDEKAYVGSVWGLKASERFAISTRADMLAEIKPAQDSIHERPEDLAWVEERARLLFERAGLDIPPISMAFGKPTTAWNADVVVKIANARQMRGGKIVYHAEKYGLDVSQVLACPFCGGEDLVLLGPHFGSELYCRCCFARTPNIDPPQGLLDFWNSRKAGLEGSCRFCGNDHHVTIEHNGHSAELCKGCGAYGPASLHFSNGATIEARWMWLAEDGIITVPACIP